MDEELSPDAARELTVARLKAGAYWCVPSLSVPANALAYDLMRTFYTPGPPSTSGVWSWSPPAVEVRRGAVAMTLLRRHELPLATLAHFLARGPADDPDAWLRRAAWERDLTEAPFVFVPDDGGEAAADEALARADAFLAWLGWPSPVWGGRIPAPQE